METSGDGNPLLMPDPPFEYTIGAAADGAHGGHDSGRSGAKSQMEKQNRGILSSILEKVRSSGGSAKEESNSSSSKDSKGHAVGGHTVGLGQCFLRTEWEV